MIIILLLSTVSFPRLGIYYLNSPLVPHCPERGGLIIITSIKTKTLAFVQFHFRPPALLPLLLLQLLRQPH